MQNYDLKSLFPTYSVIEGLTIVKPDSNTSTSSQTITSGDLSNSYPIFDSIAKTQLDMSRNIYALNATMTSNIDNDILDENGKLNTKGRLVDVARQDVQNILIQQNTLYMIGTMTIATLLITAILISKK